MVNVSELSLSDLLGVYQVVKQDYNQMFGNKKEAKQIIEKKMEEVKRELYLRVYGCNPYEKLEQQITVTSSLSPEEVLKNLNV